MQGTVPPRRPGRAATLIERILAARILTEDNFCVELHITSRSLAAYRDGSQPMPLNHQARLALFVIASVPEFLKEGNRLREQVAADIAYRSNMAEVP